MIQNSLFDFNEIYTISDLYMVYIHYHNKVTVDIKVFEDFNESKKYAYEILKNEEVEYVEYSFCIEKKL